MSVKGLTVAVCTHNRLELLRRALATVRRAKRPRGLRTEILVVANACTDGTEEWLTREAALSAHANGWPLRFVSELAPGKIHALNRLRTLDIEDLIAFVDDDHRVDRLCFESLVAAARRFPETGLFCGRILPDWDGREPAWVHDTGPYRLYPLPVPRFDLGETARTLGPQGPYPGGGNLAVRREVLQRAGPFRAGFGPVGHNLGGAEDIEWVRRALSRGERLRYVPGMIQYHYVDPARFRLRYLLRKAYERSASVVRLEETGAAGVLPPLHMWSKVLDRLARLAAHAGNPSARRFYAMRLAGALGELKGYGLRRKDARHPAVFLSQ
ncbi:Glycosyltransferase, GT2 family [Desulfacinum hydrothermale DSM 13146]|uniref:Glycosyltransferase, GT2 family n=1 Tax=Desulfacinum hydrothermale DSM 13146 TaxID=1121390 RepID=A0A1W1XR38_9BACT|nr:glycosyltransferase [Desulfacinum hydrothermale]SMC26347.1 Glycosyltransferase, GT2 family [Desulfacinum hydrothermale DSM 13146]